MLLVAVLLSELASRSVLSTAAIFLVAGFVAGPGVLDLIDLNAEDPVVESLATVTLFAVLFTDGMRVSLSDLRQAWRLPGSALLLGMPVTLGLTAVLGYGLTDLSWAEAFLVAAALAPTDPVFASAIIGQEEVPRRVRHLLNVESGLNDGLALPVVLAMLALTQRGEPEWGSLGLEVVAGVGVGVGLTAVALWLERSPLLKAREEYESLYVVAIAVLLFAVCQVLHANAFLAAFAGGITLATIRPDLRVRFHELGEVLSELLKLGAVLVFGALVAPSFFTEFGPLEYLFMGLVLFAVRPVAMAVALLPWQLRRSEYLATAWFGPKGFASVVYGLLIVKSGGARADHLFHLIAVVVAASMLLHSSTDVPIASWFQRQRLREGEATA